MTFQIVRFSEFILNIKITSRLPFQIKFTNNVCHEFILRHNFFHIRYYNYTITIL